VSPGSGAQAAERLPLPGLQLLERLCLRGRLLPGFDIAAKGGNFGPIWPEVGHMSADPRELTRRERAAIRRLVTGMCANYDPEYGCIPLNCACYMLNKCWTGAYCKYFQTAVLPLDPVLKADLTRNHAVLFRKTCPVCGAAYLPVTNQTYCSEACRRKGKREADRRRQQRHRCKNKG
jgi:predicted nucleic acid-binding Zn ribbon protein